MVASADDRRAFIAAIRANPADDAPRLIYADWLEERGEAERAEFIRVQCELARSPSQVLHNREAEIYQQSMAELWPNSQERRKAWGVDGLWGDTQITWEWIRGFIDQCKCTAADWLQFGDAILAEHPVQEVSLSDNPAMAIPVAESGFEDGALVFVIAGKRVRHEWPFARLHPAGRTAEWCKSLLETRWPGVVFHLPEQERFVVHGRATVDHSGMVHVVERR